MDTTQIHDQAVEPICTQDVAEPYPHLAARYRADAARSDSERIELIRKGVVIEHAAYSRAMDYAHWILSQPPGTPGKGMLLMGAPGTGKSTFGEELTRETDRKVIVISAEGARTMRECYGRILQVVDGPVARRMHGPDRELAVLRIFRALGVKALVVDEVQDLAKGTNRELQQVLCGIKYLTNAMRIPLFFLGTPEALSAFRSDQHLAQRLRNFYLPTWNLDQSFADLVAVVLETLPLQRESTLRNEATLRYLLEISGGSLRNIMDRITCAAVRSILSGEERLTLQGLKDAEFVPARHGTGVKQDG